MLQLFHVLNRGVDKRTIFLDEQDYFRFIHDLYEFNDENWVENTYRSFNKTKQNRKLQLLDIASPTVPTIRRKPRKLLVDIHAFCLMPNHYHLLLSPRKEKAISLFMKKVNIGYARYFNERNKRVGTLFQGRFKSVPVIEENHFYRLPYYIHCNPLDLLAPSWRESKLTDYKEAINFLENYRWSSHLDYLGKTNFPSVTSRNFLTRIFQGEKEYKKSIYSWLKDMDIENLSEITLEQKNH